MKRIAMELESIIQDYAPRLSRITAEEYALKPRPEKWSRKEILGHLIDSAENNIRRFLVAQYESSPKIVYNQDEWVRLNHYQSQDAVRLLNLWEALNQQAVNILKNTEAGNELRTCESQSVNTLEWLAKDYIKHLKHHLHQILSLEPIPYP